MRTLWKRILVGGVAVVAISQLARPSRVNPPVTASHTIEAQLTVDPAVAVTLKRSCNDCHSNLSVWPWYSNIAPISWVIAYDVRRGRRALNFSEWATYSSQEQDDQLKEICTEVSDKEMPGTPYTLLHPEAKLTDADTESICAWTKISQPEVHNLPRPAPGNLPRSAPGNRSQQRIRAQVLLEYTANLPHSSDTR